MFLIIPPKILPSTLGEPYLKLFCLHFILFLQRFQAPLFLLVGKGWPHIIPTRIARHSILVMTKHVITIIIIIIIIIKSLKYHFSITFIRERRQLHPFDETQSHPNTRKSKPSTG